MYTEKELNEAYERGVRSGKVEVINDLISVINSTYGRTYSTFHQVVMSFVKMMASKLEGSSKLK